MVINYFIAKHEVSAEGLFYRKLVAGTTKHLRWSDLRAVRYSPLAKCFHLETHSGGVARISVMLTGLPDFARLLLAHAPGGAVDAETLHVLEATAEGHPPSVWI